ncbi:MAG: hypothetical protein ABJA66_13905 [Actinomycetota bacterium]
MSKFKKFLRLRVLFMLFVIFAAAIVYAKISTKTKNFKQADDFPRDALIYAQVQDLPAFIKLWNESKLKSDYLESENFAEFESNHLALKLVERWKETNAAVGFQFDTSVLSVLSENKAALAIYDIGKLEMVFIAPMSEEKILATSFFVNSTNFEEITLADGTIVYSREAEVDRNRQKQKILFSNVRGRFVLATSEKYFLQTLENIKGKTPNNRLSSEPDFKQLAEKTTPNLATVWLNQNKLNDDWYFKHYWLMSDVSSLKNLRAGMFDFEINGEKLVEKRVFLSDKNKQSTKISPEIANRLLELVPSETAFYIIQPSENNNPVNSINEIFFDQEEISTIENSNKSRKIYYFNDSEKSHSYSSLDSSFEKQIDENEDEETAVNDSPGEQGAKLNSDFAKIIGQAQPTISVKLFSPQTLPPPLFFDNRKALIFTLQNPSAINREAFEKTLIEFAGNKLTAALSNSNFEWEDLPDVEFQARQLKMPSLGWKIYYAFRNKELVFSNSEDLLKSIFSEKKTQINIDNSYCEFSVIQLNEREKAFDSVMKNLRNEELKSDKTSQPDFFADNIASLLDVVSDVERIEIKRNSNGKFLFEEIDFVLKKNE